MVQLNNDLLVGPVVPANGVSLISLDFYFEDETHLEVYKDGSEVPLTLGVDYTVTEPSAIDAADGSITLAVAANGTDSYAVFLQQPLQREADLQFRGDLRSPVLNLELNRIWRAVQGLNTALNRTFRFSRNSDIPDPIETLNDASRQNKLLQFSADGSRIEAGADVAAILDPSADALAASLSAAAAATSETNAATSATDAATSATNAGTSASNAAASAAAAAASLDDFDDRYLGAKSSDPTLDNDGDALQTGALYFNTTDNLMKVYDGAAWGVLGPAIASQAEAEAGTDNTTLMTPLRTEQAIDDKFNITGSPPTFACRAWVLFDGTGTVSIRGSGNVSSITDLGTGQYRINFTIAMPDANYCAICSQGELASSNVRGLVGVNQYSTTSIEVTVTDGSNSVINRDAISVAIFR